MERTGRWPRPSSDFSTSTWNCDGDKYAPVAETEICVYCAEAGPCHLHIKSENPVSWSNPVRIDRDLPFQSIDTTTKISPLFQSQYNYIKEEVIDDHFEPTTTKNSPLFDPQYNHIKQEVTDDHFETTLADHSTSDECQSHGSLEDYRDYDLYEEFDYKSENIEKIVSTIAFEEKRRPRGKDTEYVCDICEASFTLKQSVQTHLFKYHMLCGPVPVERVRARWKCIICLLMSGFSIGELMMMTPSPCLRDLSPSPSPSRVSEESEPSPSSPSHSSSSSSSSSLRAIMGQGAGEFLTRMRALFERAAAEKERREVEEATKKKRERLEGKIRQMQEKMFRTAGAAEFHDKRHHKKDEKKPSRCDECGKQFTSASQLKEHISILHLMERKYACEICGQKFGRRGGVRRHVQMVHLNQLHRCPYEQCDHPGYKCSKALAAHIRSVHTNQRPYNCVQCGKNFVRRNDLKMHELTHSEVNAFVCVCGSSFRRSLYLRKHQRDCPSASRADSSPDEADSSVSND